MIVTDNGAEFRRLTLTARTSQLDRIRAMRKSIDALGKTIDLEVDGGIDPGTAKQVVAAGADVLVAGTASFKGGPSQYTANLKAVRGARLRRQPRL